MTTAERRSCPVCLAGDAASFLDKADLHLVRCSRCGMIFASPLPAEASDDYYDQLGRPYYLSPDKLAGDYAAVRFERELRLLRRVCPTGSVLDVGCSTGAFLFQLRQRWPQHYHGQGIEVSGAAIEYARERGVQVISDSLLTHDFGGTRFDVVTFWAVLEHLAEPGAFVRRAFELLRSGGHCVVLVPNARSLAMRCLGAKYRYILSQHVNYFEAPTLEGLLVSAGFQAVSAGGSHFNPMVIWQDWRRGTADVVSDHDRADLLRRTTRMKQSGWLRPAKVALGWVEGALAMAGLADNLWWVGRKP
ncbi:MAG: methyltransferase domain-containing protein [Verrucomicrobiales bacterium]|nr:methyltransferase domain-containing protein [Verrucomicrobiales bacterium]